MAVRYDTASLRFQLSSEVHNISEIWMLVEAVDNIAMGGVWAELANSRTRNEAYIEARQILNKKRNSRKAGNRFFPDFNRQYYEKTPDDKELFIIPYLNTLDPFDPLDSSIITGLNSWIRKEIYGHSPKLFSKIFDFANVRKLEHQSPLVLEIAVGIAIAATSPMLITYGIMKAISSLRRSEAEADIRKTEAKLREEELKQRRIETAIKEEIYESVREKREKQELDLPDEAISAAISTTSPAVADLGSSSLINNVTFGVTSKC